MESHERLILGNALETILDASEKLDPVISEYQFKRDVLDILVNPFSTDQLLAYSVFVGELTKPLRVVNDTDPNEVLFVVPALVQSPVVTIAKDDGLTTGEFLRTLSRDIELGGKYVNSKIEAFMLSITKPPNFTEEVIKPITAILSRYGRVMAIPTSNDTQNNDVKTDTTKLPENKNNGSSSFSDEYID